MSWEGFYLVCFLVGFFLSLFSFMAGSAHGHPHLHVARGMHGHGPGGRGGKGSQASPVNFGTIAAFLAWFGGTGYLLSRFSSIWALLALGIAVVSGLGGAAVIFWFLFKVLLAHERDLDPADYEMAGVLGHVSSAVHAGGTGEMIFSQNGVRRSASIRNETGEAIAKGIEVMVTRYEKGIAYVRPWEDVAGERAQESADQ